MCSIMEEIRAEGRAEGMEKTIVALRRVGAADTRIKSLLIEEFQILSDEADSYLRSV